MVSAMRPQARPKVAVAKKRLKMRLVFTRCPAVDTTTRKRAQIAYRRRAVLRSKLRGNTLKLKIRSKNGPEMVPFEANSLEGFQSLPQGWEDELPPKMKECLICMPHGLTPATKTMTREGPKVFSFNTKNMEDLRLPFLDSSTKLPPPDEEYIKLLRWEFSFTGIPVDYEAWEHAEKLHDQEKALNKYASHWGPHWNLPPTKPPERLIAKFTTHLALQYSLEESHVQIPANWPIFTSVDWDQKHIFRQALTDSSESKHEKNYGRVPLSDGDDYDSDVSLEATFDVRATNIQEARKRCQVELLEIMDPVGFPNWRYQTEEGARRRNAMRHSGYFDYNQTSKNRDIWPQTSMAAFLSPTQPPPSLRMITELCSADNVGRLIGNIMATDAFPSQHKRPLQWPAYFSPKKQTALIDYTFRCSNFTFGHYESFRPLLYAAQQRRKKFHEAERDLAFAFQPMMTLFILYYLDTRSTLDEPMPPWLVLFGAIYDGDGLYHQACYPSFEPRPKSSSTAWGWGVKAVILDRDGQGALSNHTQTRGIILAELYRIQGHCIYVLERLKTWDGYDRACRLLSTW